MVFAPRAVRYRVTRVISVLASVVIVTMGVLAPVGTGLTGRAFAAGPCTVTNLNPHDAPDGSETGFAFTVVDNNDDIAWIRVTSPSGNLAINNAASDWLPNTSVNSTDATFWGDPILAGNPLQVSVSAAVSSFPPDNWTVEASTDQGGSSPMTCGGDTSISVTDTTPPNITSISSHALTTSATVTWSTDKLTTGVVDYGLDTGYGQQVPDNTVDTSHSVTITGLQPSTTYHYQITAIDQSSNSSTSVDATFVTATQPTSTTGGGGGGGGGSVVTVVVTNPGDKIPPSISITSSIPKIFTTEPTVSGKADDNDKITRIEYSTDGGQNWLAVDTSSGLNTKHATFSFTPLNLSDDTYVFMARAFDGGGNSAQTVGVSVVVDRLPPVVGGTVIALGPQILIPDNDGNITTLPNVTLSISTSSTGGATDVSIDAVDTTSMNKNAATNFALQQAPDSGLWSGALSFSKPGIYELVARARDGANNITKRTIGMVRVARSGSAITATGPLAKALITAYYRDPDTNSWTLWDGLPYGQQNPQRTDKSGGFQMLLPAGTYYLHAAATGYLNLDTRSFALTQPTPLTVVLHMQTAFGFGPFYASWLNFATEPITNSQSSRTTTSTSAQSSLVGSALPTFTLSDTAGHAQNSVGWLGKPTVLTLLSTWSPATSEQLAALDQLAANQDINTEVIGLQENAARLRAFNAIEGSSLTWLADPTSQSIDALRAGSLPMHYFVDRKGIVREVTFGVLTYQQLIDRLTSLP